MSIIFHKAICLALTMLLVVIPMRSVMAMADMQVMDEIQSDTQSITHNAPDQCHDSAQLNVAAINGSDSGKDSHRHKCNQCNTCNCCVDVTAEFILLDVYHNNGLIGFVHKRFHDLPHPPHLRPPRHA